MRNSLISMIKFTIVRYSDYLCMLYGTIMNKNTSTKKLISTRMFFSEKYAKKIKMKKVLQGGKLQCLDSQNIVPYAELT